MKSARYEALKGGPSWSPGRLLCMSAALLAGMFVGAVVMVLYGQGALEWQSANTGFYVHPMEGRFRKMAAQAGTDKVNLEASYHNLFELGGGHPKVKKMMEIGLGCNMEYGPGKSASLWHSYFPNAEIWFAEYDAKCVANHQDKLQALNVKAVVGDQAVISTVRGWIKQTEGNFDFIVDDGGHGNAQMYVSFMMLFQHALKPGGAYVIEDLSVSRLDEYQGGPANSKVVMIDVLKDWIEVLLTYPTQAARQKPDLAYMVKHKMPPGIKSIRCSAIACTVVKCYTDDIKCSYGGYEDAQPDVFGMA